MLVIYKLVYFIWPLWSLQQDWKISNEGPFFRFSWDRQKLLVDPTPVEKFVSQLGTWPAATRVFLPTTKGGREERPWERGCFDCWTRPWQTECGHARISRTWYFGMYNKLRECFHYKCKITFRIALLFWTNIKYSQHVSMWLSVGIRWTSFTAGYLVYLRPWLAAVR